MFELNDHQYTALKKASDFFGQSWKAKLKDCWMKSEYPTTLKPYKSELQQIRNKFGSTWLNAFQFDA